MSKPEPQIDSNADTPALSPGAAQTIVTESPRHAWTRCRSLGNMPKATTDAMEAGKVLHALLLGEPQKLRVWQENSFRSREARAFRDRSRAEGFIPIIQEKLPAVKATADRLKNTIATYGYDLTEGASEQRIDWMEPSEHGDVLCKGYLDWLSEDRTLILDVKTTKGSTHPDICAAKLEKEGGCIQDVAYRRAVEFHTPKLAGRVQMIFLFCQTVEPFAVTPVICGASMRELGESRWARALHLWSMCLAAGKEKEHWPAYIEEGGEPAIVDAPKWALARELEEEW